jgi:hypothetical protein
MAIESVEKKTSEIIKETKDRVEHTDPKYGDIFSVEGLPKGMEACWGNTKKESLEESKWRDRYQVVNSNTAPDARTIGKQLDGTHVIGDAILMMRPKELGDRIRKDQADMAKARRDRVKREFQQEGEKAGMKTFDK